jgi:hypothetical protein
MLLFDSLQGDPIAESCARIAWQKVFRKALDANTIRLAENGCPLNNVSKFSQIARPVVLFEGLKRLLSETEKEMMPGLAKKS